MERVRTPDEQGRPPGGPGRRVIRGRVMRQDGAGLAGVPVRIGLGRPQAGVPLGETRTDEQGRYELAYTAVDRAGLLVRANLDAHHTIEVLVPPSAQTVDLTVLTVPGERRSEYEELLADIVPLLGTATLAERRAHRDLGELAGASGRDLTQVGCLALAHRYATDTGLPAELFYGLLRQCLPARLPELAGLTAAELRWALGTAADQNVISATSPGEAVDFVARLRIFRLRTRD
ncbi:carboxypeptidase-like regulatory domain-containing protein [Amycolatopsis nigrescens]|uniref:carboxypeptidase-like regulatory domain-containing protein n=1 Tax=Amycolatopsis nigrescens TaxID=381445 RepID=UPI00146E8C00|nr:carboxypeptidase-like regulatory domain-containing protein [Amycolatopsis nigrescens]